MIKTGCFDFTTIRLISVIGKLTTPNSPFGASVERYTSPEGIIKTFRKKFKMMYYRFHRKLFTKVRFGGVYFKSSVLIGPPGEIIQTLLNNS